MDLATVKRVWGPMVLGAVALVAIFRAGEGQPALRWVGLAFGLIGLAGVITARYTLGRSFSVKAKATALVTTGIYSKIRNPIYVSGIIFIAGAVMMMGSPYGFGILAIVIPLQIVRARREAKVLEEAFGDEYRDYRRQTWF